MHELGVVMEVVQTVVRFAGENGITEIDTLVLQIGELSAMIPRYIEAVYPAAADGTLLEKTNLRIEIIPGNGKCRQCGTIMNLAENKGSCPKCGSCRMELLSGKEFMIKEILVPQI